MRKRRLYKLAGITPAVFFLLLFSTTVLATDAPQALLAQADTKIAAKDYQGAITLLDQIVVSYPQSAESAVAGFKKGDCLTGQGKRLEALDAYRWVIANHPESPVAPDATRGIAYTYLGLGNRAEAAKAFEALMEKYPESPHVPVAHLRIGMIYLGDSRTDIQNRKTLREKALASFAQALSSSKGNADVEGEAALQILGMRFEGAIEGKEDWSVIESALDNFEQDHPNASEKAKATVQLMKAERAMAQKDFVGAQEIVKDFGATYAGLRTESAWAALLLGYAYHQQNMYQQAIDTFDDLVSKYTDKDNFAGNNVRAMAVYAKIKCLEKLGNRESAESARTFLKQTWPSSVFATESD